MSPMDSFEKVFINVVGYFTFFTKNTKCRLSSSPYHFSSNDFLEPGFTTSIPFLHKGHSSFE